MAGTARQKDLVLILCRDLASKLATPVAILDAEGTLVDFNEAAEKVLGQTFAETGELKREEWRPRFSPRDQEGRPVPLEEHPLGIVLSKRRPAHREFRIRRADGVERDLAVTAFPLYARRDEFLGAMAVFWQQDEA